MSENYSTVLTRCMAVSFAALLTALLGILHPLIPFALAMAPLVWYHVGYLRKISGDGISQPAVDSVYYYGFLVTIGALGVTALELSLRGVEGDLSAVAFQFGLGLLATGYAVWARINLTASSKLLDEGNLEEAMDKYVARSRELISNVELATSSFENYANSVVAKTEEFASRVEAQTQAAIDAAASQLREAVMGMAEESKLALSDLRGIINDTTFGSEREALRSSVTSMVETTTQLSLALSDLGTNAATGASTVGEFAGSLGKVTTHATSAAARLEKMGEKEGVLEKFSDTMASGGIAIADFSSSMGSAAVSSGSLAKGLSGSAAEIGALTDSAKMGAAALRRIANADSGLVDFASEISSVTDSLNDAAKSASHSKASFDDVVALLSNLQSTLTNLNAALVDSTGGLKDSMFATSEALETHYQSAVQRRADLNAHLLEVKPTIVPAEATNGAS